MPDTDLATREYAVAPGVRVLLLGTALVLIGVLVALVAALVAYAGVPGGALTGAVVVAVVGVLLLGLALARPVWVLRTDEVGYRIRFVRGAGVRSARWLDVATLATGEVAGSRVVLLRLRDDGLTRVPVDLLGADPEQLVRELGRRLGR